VPELALSNEQFRALVKAIRDAFVQSEFESLLDLECGKRLDELVGLPMLWGPLVTSVVRKAQMQAFTNELVLAVAAWRPRNVALASVLRELSAMPGEGNTLAVSGALRGGKSAAATLEGLVRGTAAYADVDQFLADLASIASRVCRIEVSGGPDAQPEALGTGFLVGDDLVLTNQHVRAELPADPARFACRFDYRALAGSVATRAGTAEKPVTKDWLVAERDHADSDTQADGSPPSPKQLDYALLRLSAPVGRYARGRADEAATAADARGHLALAANAPTLQPGDDIFVLQHPAGAPMKLAVGRVLPGAPPYRIWHDAPTEGGTSGSPCFNQALKLVAMHHATDAAQPQRPAYNQAVPIGLIAADLLAQGKL
jgi:hypothetical protein